jgi:hypothetical protein
VIKLVDLLRENIGSNIINDAKTLSKEDFLKKYSTKKKEFGTYEPHVYISINNNQPYIRLNDKIIEVTPSEYDDWSELKLKQEYDTSKPVLLKYTTEYDDAQVVDGHHRVKYIIDKDINGELGYVLDDESLEDLWNTFN